MTTEPRGGHPYYMYDAIQKQPEKVEELLRERSGAVKEAAAQVLKRQRLHLVGIGTSWHAALVAEFWMREAGGWHNRVRAWNSFEFASYPPPLGAEDVVIIITHTGAKRSSLRAFEIAKERGAFTICLSSTGADPIVETASVVLRTCERDRSAAFTISYTSALAVLGLLAVEVRRGVDADEAAQLEDQLKALPQAMNRVLNQDTQIKELASRYSKSSRFYFVGWGGNAASAYEAALKMKETSFTVTEGFELEQLLHGPFLSSDRETLLTLIAPPGPGYERAREIAQAFATVGASTVALVAEGDKELTKVTTDALYQPSVPDLWSPLSYIVPLQLFTYYVALKQGRNPDLFRRDDPVYAEVRQHISL